MAAPGATADRTAILDGYATQLTRRDEAADRRERALSARERDVRAAQARAHAAERELDQLRAELYAERSAAKQREERVRVREADADARARVVQELVAASKATAADLAAKRQQTQAASDKLASMYAALRNAQDSLAALRTREERVAQREQECTDVVGALDTRQAELDALQGELQRLQEQVARREASVADTAALLPLKDVLPALRQAQDEFRALRRRRSDRPVSPTPRRGTGDEARSLAAFFGEVTALARALDAREQTIQRREDALTTRERGVDEAKEKASIALEAAESREREAARREAAAEDAKQVLRQVELNMQRVVDAEHALDKREQACRDSERRAADREAHIARQRKLLAAQEKSIRRAGDTVRHIEGGIAREKEENKQTTQRLQALEDELATREALLNTRMVELDVREARQNRSESAARANNSLAQARRTRLDSVPVNPGPVVDEREQVDEPEERILPSEDAINTANPGMATAANASNSIRQPTAVHEANSDEEVMPVTGGANAAAAPNTNEANIGGASAGAAAGAGAGGPSTAQTVRKQLTFGRTPVAAEAARSESGSDVGVSGGGSGGGVERASELRAELRAERAAWVEKAERLDTVATGILGELQSTGSQLLPAIDKVREELGAIRTEAGTPWVESGDVGSEKARQREWGRRMSAQLETINQVHAGLYDAFNRVLPEATPVAPPPTTRREPLRTRLQQEDNSPPSQSRVEQLLKEIDITPKKTRRPRRKGTRVRGQGQSRALVGTRAQSVTISSDMLAPPQPQPPPPLPSVSRDLINQPTIKALRRELGLDES